jgi:hypothetical protein
MSPDGFREFKPLTPRASEIVLADLDLFFSENPSWGEISLLKAGGQDHRLIARIKAGESFRTSTVDDLYATMNKAARGDLKPDAFRNTVARKSAAATAAKAAASGITRKDANHGTKRKPARR